jgi:carboxyl-terminal processing protease
MRKHRIAIGFMLGVIVSAFVFFSFKGPSERYFEIARNLDIFATLFKEVNTFYVDEVSPEELMRVAIDSMLSSLDPYTNFIPEEGMEAFQIMTTGQYAGIGALIGQIDQKTIITMPYEGFPAQKSGLRIGDEIVEIDGVKIEGKQPSEVSKLLKGQPRTEVHVKVKRFGHPKLLEYKIKRERITVNNVTYYGIMENNTGYIRLEDFTQGAGREVQNALIELKSKGADKLILDLRGNPGGLLNEAINVANIFLKRGSEIVSTKGKIEEWNKTYKALNGAVDTEIPLVILIDGASASAAEIVAGAIQDYDRGVLIGRKSFGKGLVQTTRPLAYRSQLKVTTAKYYIPSGRCIQTIDYSRKLPDTLATKAPLTFSTKLGRKMQNTGGLDPDLTVQEESFAPITASLVFKGHIFEYANQFYFKNPQIAPASSFKLTNQQYDEFIKWLEGKDYDYTTQVEANLEQLEGLAMEEKYFKEIKDHLFSLKQRVQHNKEQDLINFKAEIQEVLHQEIASRYYYYKGALEASFSYDKDLTLAQELINDTQKFKSFLSVN